MILLAFILFLSAVPAQASSQVDSVFGKIDLAFERNEGQADPSVKFFSRGAGYGLFLTGDDAVIRFTEPRSAAIRMQFLGHNRNVRVEGVDGLPGTTNYLLGTGSAYRTHVPSYKKVRYSEVYPGIDIEYHGNGRLLEYDFVVRPGSNPGKIRIGFSGIRSTSVDSFGDLVLKTDGAPVVQKKPHVYQNVDGRETVIEAAYVVSGDHVGFKIGRYDKTRTLIIDPVLIYSSYFGGTGTEQANGIAVDPQGSVYITGTTTSTDLPILSAAQDTYKGGTDAFVLKMDPTGSQTVYSTFIGGASMDEAHGIAVDAGGNAYITGFTQSTDFPVVNGFQKTRAGAMEAYFLKLNSSGTAIVFSTYLGGTADDRGTGIALDAGNNVYITGTTASSNFPTASPYQQRNAGGFADGFVAKIGAGGNLIYSTYLGGLGNDNPLGIAVDGSGAAYVTGWTTSIDFPRVNAFQTKFGGRDQPVGTDDVFVTKLNPAGSALDYSTYVGGTGTDEATRIAVDPDGNAYVTGLTNSLDFPTQRPYQALLSGLSGIDAFLFKLSPDGRSLVFSTYFGGFQTESGTGIAVDPAGTVYLAGYTNSFDLPTANQTANQAAIGGDRDAFVAKFDPGGSVLVFSTFLGGSGTESATGLAIDASRNVYVTGFTTGGDFPTANPMQPANGGGQDAFVVKLNAEDIVAVSLFQVAPQGVSSVITKGTRTDAVFGYAEAGFNISGTMAGLAIIDRKQNGATVSEVGIPAPPFVFEGRLFVDVSSTARSVLSIANPNDEDATVNFTYLDATGANKSSSTTVKAHQHFSRFVTDDPLLVTAPGTVNFASSVPVAATAFLTETNESGELLLSNTPIVDPGAYSTQVGDQPVTLPELADGGGWRSDIVLVNASEERLDGEVRFFSQGAGVEPGTPMEVGIGDGTTAASVLEFDIPPHGFQRVSTAGGATVSNLVFEMVQGTSIRTPGSGPFQTSGFASADTTIPDARLTGLEILEYRQLGITQSQTGVVAPSLRVGGSFVAEVTDKIRSFIAVANPNDDDVTLQLFLTDESGTSTDPVSVGVPAHGQYSAFVADAPISMAAGTTRTVTFSTSLPVFVTALRFFTNERSDSLLSTIPIADTTAATQPVVIPHFADGAGWKTQVVLVNTSNAVMRGEIRFLSPGTATEPPHGVVVGTAIGPNYVFEYDIPAHSFYRLQTDGSMENVSVGSIQIVPFELNVPAAHGVISHFVIDQPATDTTAATGNTIFETSVQGQLPATSFRLYAEAFGDFEANKPKSTRTTVAIANPFATPVTVQLELTSFGGVILGTSSALQIPGNGQLGKYLSEIPGLESVKAPFQGTLRITVLSGTGVTTAGFRVMINERSDYLATTTGPVNEDAGMPGHLIFPYMTDSTGYTTQFILIEPPGVQNTGGVLRYLASDGTPLHIDILKLGSIQIVPFMGFTTPHAHVVLFHREAGILSFMTSVEGQRPQGAFRMYAESIGDFDSGIAGSTRSAVAIANPSATPATVRLEMSGLDGAVLGTSQPVQVPPNGQVAFFLNQVPGLATLAAPFQGVLRVVATSPEGVTAAGFRAEYNERGNALFTTTGPLIENAGTATHLIFPHIAEGGGYTTQFIVIGGNSGQPGSGVLQFFNEEGSPLNVTLSVR